MKKYMILVLVLASCSGRPHFEPIVDLPNHLATDPTREKNKEVDNLIARKTWTLDDLLRLAESINPGLQVSRTEVEFAETEVWEAGLYPNPTLTYEFDDSPVTGSDRGKGTHTATFSLPLVYSGRQSAAEHSARLVRKVRASEWEEHRLLLRSRIKRAFAKVLYLEEARKLAQELRKVAKEFFELTKVRFSAGDIAEMEVLKSKVSLSRLDLESTRMAKEVEAAYRELFRLVGRVDLPSRKLIGKLDSAHPVLDFKALQIQVLANNHRLRRAKKERDAEVGKRDLARTERWPDVGITLGFGRNTAEGDNVVEGGIEIPLPLFNRNQAKIAGAEIRIRQADYRVAAIRNEILADLSRIFADYATAREAALRYKKEILPSAIMSYKQTREGYTNKKFSYLDILDSQRTLVETRSAHLLSLRNLAWAVADLERITGGGRTFR